MFFELRTVRTFDASLAVKNNGKWKQVSFGIGKHKHRKIDGDLNPLIVY